jgi:glyoxalase family protein
MQLTGIHHLTAVTAAPSANNAFYTGTLGMRLVKKTVNQDDTSAYHLFYGDGRGSPGSDITFFDWPMPRERRGTRSIVRTGLRVAGAATLDWWRDRLASAGIAAAPIVERHGRLVLDFEDPEGQRLSLVDDGGAGAAHPYALSTVPAEHQIRGLGPIAISTPEPAGTDAMLRDVLGMRQTGGGDGPSRVYAMGEGGPAAELQLLVEPALAAAQLGAGGVHHVAFRIPDQDYRAWDAHLRQRGVRSSGPVDRFYFRSLYFRDPSGVLFEIATDGPGFAADEPVESLGRKLSLPPFLEGRRREIEAGLKPL